MSWSRLPLLLGVLALGPAGCGFHPLYGRPDTPAGTAVSQEMAGIRVQPIDDRLGQKLRNELISRLNPRGEPGAAKYVLTVKTTENIVGLAHSQDGTATLAELTFSASFTLADASAKGKGTGGSANTVVSTDFLGPRYASVSAERDAEDRAITQIAEQIIGQIAVYLNRPDWRPATAAPLQAPGIQHYQIFQGLPTQPGQPDSTPASPGAAPP